MSNWLPTCPECLDQAELEVETGLCKPCSMLTEEAFEQRHTDREIQKRRDIA